MSAGKRKRSIIDYGIVVLAAFFIFTYAGMAFIPIMNNKAQEPAITEQKTEEPEKVESAPEPIKLDDLKAHFIDVGQGDSELLQLPDGKTMLIDAGEASAGSTVVDYLKGLGVKKIDYLVATHPHADHIGGIPAVLNAFDVGELWMPNVSENTESYSDFLDSVEAKGLSVAEAKCDKRIVREDAGYEVTVLGPKTDVRSDDMNDYSVIVRVTYGDTSMLFTGDASASEIVASNSGHVNILKAAHHGSETGTTTEVMNTLKPSDVIMSYAEGNDYGHPDQSVLDAVSTAGAKAYSTAANGNIIVTSDGSETSVKTSKSDTITAGVSAAERAKLEEEAKAKAQAEAEEKAQQEAEAKSAAQIQQQQKQMTVYVTPKGKKYHLSGCRTLSRSKNLTPMSEQAAINAGYEPCSVCNP